jgi:hypothetical protein
LRLRSGCGIGLEPARAARQRPFRGRKLQSAAGPERPSTAYPLTFVVDLNLHRRHLNESQRAMVAARLANMVVGGREANAPIGAIGAVSQDDAADKLNVARRSVQRATVVRDNPVLAPLVDRRLGQGRGKVGRQV